MTYTEFCTANHVTIWSARRTTSPDRWRIIVQWHDGSRHQMTLQVRSRQRPEAVDIIHALALEALAFEADPAGHLRYWEAQRKLLRFLGPELYAEVLTCTD